MDGKVSSDSFCYVFLKDSFVEYRNSTVRQLCVFTVSIKIINVQKSLRLKEEGFKWFFFRNIVIQFYCSTVESLSGELDVILHVASNNYNLRFEFFCTRSHIHLLLQFFPCLLRVSYDGPYY